MTDWDLLIPGAGLTSVGAIGVAVALSGIAKTFMDGMHAVSILLMFFGLIFLSGGLFKDGFPSSKKAKTAAAVILTLFVTVGIIGAIQVSDRVPSILSFIAIIATISIPTLIIIIASYKKYDHLKKITIACISLMIIGSGIIISASWIGSPVTADSEEQVDGSTEGTIPKVINATVISATIPPGASGPGNPSYEPAIIIVKKGDAIEWSNNDNAPHTVTSFKDDGASFDSSIILAGQKYILDTTTLTDSEYEYFCTLHPFMKGKIVLQ
ncbi:MAG: cupredoxin domain-containing protein [Nitrosopumilus sp.]|nr:cupredoxin domain-containing protein [Nitrosopumilus sp.]